VAQEPDRREFPARPIVGVGAVVFDADRVLLVKRGREPLKGEWSLPGGAVEVGETLGDAIVREVREETGIAVEVGPIVDVLDRLHRDEGGAVRFHYVLVDFLCRPAGGALVRGSDADEAAWVPQAQLGSFRVAATTAAVIERAFERLRSGAWVARSSQRTVD
jgi:mutator protein MutT